MRSASRTIPRLAGAAVLIAGPRSHARMNFLVAFAAAALTVTAAAPALAADIEVAYRVDAKLLAKDAPAGTSLTLQLFAEGSCTDPVAAQAVNVENTTLIEQPKLIRVKKGPKPPSVAEIAAPRG